MKTFVKLFIIALCIKFAFDFVFSTDTKHKYSQESMQYQSEESYSEFHDRIKAELEEKEKNSEKEERKYYDENGNRISTQKGKGNALEEALSYLETGAFSYKSLISQLEFSGYSKEEATYGADNCGADWNEQAAKFAINYINPKNTPDEIIVFMQGQGFEYEQIQYAMQVLYNQQY